MIQRWRKEDGGMDLCCAYDAELKMSLCWLTLSCLSCLCSPLCPFLLTSDPESFWPERDPYWPVVQDVRPTHPEADWGVEPVLSHQPQSQGGCVGGQGGGHGLGGWLSGLRWGPRRSVCKMYIIKLNLCEITCFKCRFVFGWFGSWTSYLCVYRWCADGVPSLPGAGTPVRHPCCGPCGVLPLHCRLPGWPPSACFPARARHVFGDPHPSHIAWGGTDR